MWTRFVVHQRAEAAIAARRLPVQGIGNCPPDRRLVSPALAAHDDRPVSQEDDVGPGVALPRTHSPNLQVERVHDVCLRGRTSSCGTPVGGVETSGGCVRALGPTLAAFRAARRRRFDFADRQGIGRGDRATHQPCPRVEDSRPTRGRRNIPRAGVAYDQNADARRSASSRGMPARIRSAAVTPSGSRRHDTRRPVAAATSPAAGAGCSTSSSSSSRRLT